MKKERLRQLINYTHFPETEYEKRVADYCAANPHGDVIGWDEEFRVVVPTEAEEKRFEELSEILPPKGEEEINFVLLYLETLRRPHSKEEMRKRAPIGGKATQHFTDGEIIKAFTDFKEKHSGKSAWYAAGMLVRPGMALARTPDRKGYKDAQGAYRKLSRIAKNQQGVSVQDYYDAL